MSNESPMLNTSECVQFMTFWCEVTGAPHVTLTAIIPDGPTKTVTFTTSEFDAAAAWIARQQGANRNVYFQPNETPARCAKKPSKDAMLAGLCRHADIDPVGGTDVYLAERDRLHRLANFLKDDPTLPPTAILDSGNGIQPLWVVAREALTPEIINRIEAETQKIEAAVGAAGTHNIDRLLRLPGTVNYPNAKKQKLGRGTSRARLLHAAPVAYSAEDAATLGEHLANRLAETDLVYATQPDTDPEPDGADAEGPAERNGRDRSRAAMRIGASIRRDGGTFDDLIEELRTNAETADWFREKGQRHHQRELHRIWKKTEPKKSRTGLPVIYNSPGRLHLIATDAERALLQFGAPLYQRGRSLVRPIVSDVPASHGRTTKAAGLDEIKFHGLLDLMAQSAEWQRWDAKAETWVADDPSNPAVNIVLNRAGFWEFPSIAGIITTPTLRPDGTVLLESGYDPATRLYHVKDDTLDLSSLPTKPTRADAERAQRSLKELLTEFPFVGGTDSGVSCVDRAVALSGIITPVVRGAISVAPLHAFKATTAGTGKSFLVDIISAIATGRICPVASAGEDPVETEKRLVGLLLAGYPVVSIDNCNGELGGDLLCQAVERPLIRVRALGRSDISEIESRASIYATGNALRVCGDMVRRTLLCTLDAGMERPELRKFNGNPVAEVMAERGWYVAACLTIVMAYQQAGCPDLLPPLASFEDWSRLVRSALVWLGEADPCKSMEETRKDDPELTTLREVLGLWSESFNVGLDNAQTVRHVADKASNRTPTIMGEPTDLQFPDLRDALLRISGVGGNINTRKLGNWLADHEGRIVGGIKFQRHRTPDRGGVARWAVVQA